MSRSVALGLLAGLLLGLTAVFVAEVADRRIRNPEDLEDLADLPLLSVVPRVAFSAAPQDMFSARGRGQQANEAFHMLRSTLMFFNVDRRLSTILITSPLKGDGKTTVATSLAFATAQAGPDVILVDADLRRPQASSRLGVTGAPAAPGQGLAGALTAQVSLSDALVEIPLAETETDDELFRGRLRLLPAGGAPPNPSELLASGRMRELLRELEEMADLVIIDTNPLLSVSDSLPLFDVASGVVLVAKLNSTTKDAVRRVLKMVGNTNAALLGVVATGAVGGSTYRYAAGYGYNGYASDDHANGNGSASIIGRLRRTGRARDGE